MRRCSSNSLPAVPAGGYPFPGNELVAIQPKCSLVLVRCGACGLEPRKHVETHSPKPSRFGVVLEPFECDGDKGVVDRTVALAGA